MTNYMVLIPTKDRPKSLQKLLQSCPSLNRNTTFIGVDVEEDDAGDIPYDYHQVLEKYAPDARVVLIDNPGGYTSVAREQLRLAAMKEGGAGRYVLADDNCLFTNTALANLLRTNSAWSNCVMAGGHPTAKHFHAEQIAKTSEMRSGLTSYAQVGMIFWCVPHLLYKKFSYPDDCYFDDVYFILWCLANGFTEFRSTLDAPFNKHLHEPGGTGTAAERIRKRGQGFVRLATDFPQFMTTDILSTRVPYRRIIKAVKEGKGRV